MTKELAMTFRLHWIWIAGLLTGCTSASTSPDENLPDRFEDDLDVLTRADSRPCGADEDTNGDGKTDVRWVYSYDGQGRSKRDTGSQLDGTLSQQVDYAWDHAGHLIDLLATFGGDAAGLKVDHSSTYDTLGRRVQSAANYFSGNRVTMHSVVTYSGFDELGHAAHGDEATTDDLHGTSTTRVRSYGYDILGRQIRFDINNTDGSLFQGWRHVYDDTARTVTTTLMVPQLSDGSPGYQEVAVDSYDRRNHYLGSHIVHTSLADGPSYTTDVTEQWDGDRQRSITTTSSEPDVPRDVIRFKYGC